MKTQQDNKSTKDAIVIAVMILVGGIAFAFFGTSIDFYFRLTVLSFIILAFSAGLIGRNRKIGFGTAFFLSLFLSPILGFIFTLSSTKIKDEEYFEKMIEVAENNRPVSNTADQLYKLNELRKEGILTDDEFNTQKEKILNS